MDDYSGIEQLEKRVEWLDNERRNDKTNLASLQNRLTVLEGENLNLRKQIKELEMLITKNTNQIASFDKYDNRIDRLNIDLTKQIRDVNERAELNLNEAIKRTKLDIEATRKSVAEIFPFTEALEPIRTEMRTYKVEDARLARLIEELKLKIQEVGRFDEDYRRSLHLLEESRRQEAKRLTDLQGEVASVRKRLEETRSRFDSFSDSFRTLDTRIAELQTFEKDRKQAQSVFIEKVNNSLVDKDKTFAAWEKRFNEIDKVNLNLNKQMEDLEAARQAVSKAVSGVDEVTQRFERRINEITEFQRLNDERFRQEWTGFKSDDVKRWTNYMLSQEELSRENAQQFKDLTAQLQEVDDLTSSIRDQLDTLSRSTLHHVQSILMAYQNSIQEIAPSLDKKTG
jgi:DNA repair exonuclease SbcCD ATPase subunit